MSEISGPRLPRSEGEEMSSDPVERVRKAAIGQFAVDLLDLHLVLVEVGSLRAENARLREALRPFAVSLEYTERNGWPDSSKIVLRNGDNILNTITLGCVRRARAALADSPVEPPKMDAGHE